MLRVQLLLIALLFSFPSFANEQRILIIGDSITDGYGVSKKEAYPHQLELEISKNKRNYKVINAGSSGATSAGAQSRLKWHLKKKPKILILALGANDGLRGLKTQVMKDNLAKAIDLALKNDIKVYLAGMKIPINYGVAYRQEFEKVFTDLKKEKNIQLIPFLLEGVGAQPELNQADGIHPNEKGHQRIAQTVYQAIKGDL